MRARFGSRIFFAQIAGFVATMDIELLIPPSSRAAGQSSSSLLSETGQGQQPAESGVFSALLEDAVKNTRAAQSPPLSDPNDSMESAPPTAMDAHTTGESLSDIAVSLLSQVPDLREGSASVVEAVARLLNPTGDSPQGTESIPPLLQGLTVEASHDDLALEAASAPTGSAQAGTPDSSIKTLLQPALPRDQSEISTTGEDSRAMSKPAIQNGSVAATTPVSLGQRSGDMALPNREPSDSPISDQRSSPVAKEEGSATRTVQLSDRLSAGVGLSAIIQAQGAQETTLPGPALSVSSIIGSGGGGQDSFGASAQGEREGALFQFNASEIPESLARGTQPQLFSDQFTLAQQPQSSLQGPGSSAPMAMPNQLKMAQALFGGNQTAIMTSASGMAQTVHVVLPAHDSGPLSVRISMTDQTVSTQFTTDRNDLGQFLLTRQDQLQQSLSKSGMELGQFQVQVNQEGRQETLSDRQSRRNGEAPEQRFASQDQNRQSQDRERPEPRPTRALSLFA
ncbi:MAG: flagellar hook-length control protein FliK [Nitrospira sp. CG24E]|nr:MAG: flagellar hook-length control protein FliK [Nitrospira sp. CG24E]